MQKSKALVAFGVNLKRLTKVPARVKDALS
jgi:hypothetical protein